MDFFDDMYNLKSFILVYTCIPISCAAALHLALHLLFLEFTLAIKLSKGLIEMMADEVWEENPENYVRQVPTIKKRTNICKTDIYGLLKNIDKHIKLIFVKLGKYI